ncbi:MAG: glycosyltransferase family 4 protein [bacterium]|nr:glycosyltransferase family 4 protein [bacterium]
MAVYAYYMADLTRSRTASHGIINYSLGLLSGLSQNLDSGERLVVLGNAGMKTEMEQLLPDLSHLEWHLTDEPSRAISRLVTDHVKSLRWARQAGADVLHFPKGFIPLHRPRDMRVVATLHDDIPVRYAAGDFGPEGVTRRSKYFSASIKHTLRKADAVLAVSDFTKGRLETIRPGAPIHVTHEGALSLVTARGHAWPKQQRILVFGSTHPHKLTKKTIEQIGRYLDASGPDIELLVIGRVAEDVAALIDRIPGAQHEQAFLASEDLVDLVATSRILVFGSGYEGFGLPPLEAALLGTAVVFYQIPAVAEVMGNTHFPFDDEYESFAAAMDRALTASENSLIKYGQTLAERFRWSNVARRTLEAYREVL